MAEKKYKEVALEKLRWQCDGASLGFETTDELKSGDDIIGQDRALRAIELGLHVNSPGYNIYVAGLTGTGKSTTVKRILEKLDDTGGIPEDICYVHNFSNRDSPSVLKMPAGRGCELSKDMDDLVDYLLQQLPGLLESDSYKSRRKKLLEEYQNRSMEKIRKLEDDVKKEGLAIVQLQMGQMTRPDLMPLVDEDVVTWDQLENMVEEGKFSKERFEELREKRDKWYNVLENTLRENRHVQKEAQKKLQDLQYEFVQPVVHDLIGDLKEKYEAKPVTDYLDDVENEIINNIGRFLKDDQDNQGNPMAAFMGQQKDEFTEFQINVIVDNARTKRRPVIIETAPNYKNLFGTIERVMDRFGGGANTDFTHIKAGSLLKANGGFLVVNLLDALPEPGVWQALKRTLKHRKLDIQAYDPYTMFTQTALKPEAIDVNVKVVVIGDTRFYSLLYRYDEDFRKVFKVHAEFDNEMDRSRGALKSYARFVKKICDEEKLRAFHNNAVAEVVEYGVRLAGRQNKLSTRFSDIADIMREANYWAGEQNGSIVTAGHVIAAIEEKKKRSQRIEDKLQELIDEGNIMIDVKGSRKGQVNGLAVYQTGDYSFGKPTRITARVSVGNAGIINIEREADLSGKTHNKGVLILSGYFRGQYGQNRSLSFSASLAFEQSYSGVDGDSASSTEIYALLSELSGLPLRQDIAVTGSVNQHGDIQPIGGVNQKVEGFFDVCNKRRLSGEQGVIIPHQNIADLMLRPDVVEACEKGQFHVYPVETIDEGLEILTGAKAGKRNKNGTYPDASVHGRVEKRLEELADLYRQKKKDKNEKNDDKS